MTTYQPEERPMPSASAALLCAILRDIAIVVAVVIYAVDTL